MHTVVSTDTHTRPPSLPGRLTCTSGAGASFSGVGIVSHSALISVPVLGVRAQRVADGSGASAGEQHPDARGHQPLLSALAGQHYWPRRQGLGRKQDVGRIPGFQEDVSAR